jgi:hypothetical protein
LAASARILRKRIAIATASPTRTLIGRIGTSGKKGIRRRIPHADLKHAGVARQQLFERTAERQPIRLHDQRATFVTLALAMGRTEAWLTDRTGHKSSGMIARYNRTARLAEELNLGWFVPMDTAVLELADGPPSGE